MRQVGRWMAIPLVIVTSLLAFDISQKPQFHETHTGSFLRDTIVVKVAGGRGGTQFGPYTRLSITMAEMGREVTVRETQVISVGGESLPKVPIHLYRSLVGPVQPDDELVVFGDPPIKKADEVAAERVGGVLVWIAEPGEYFVFFPRTRPIVQVSPDTLAASVTYTITTR